MRAIHVISKTQQRLEAAPYPAEKYDWYAYNVGKTRVLKSKRGRRLNLSKGSKFGIRPATSKKGMYRLIVEEFGPGVVFTINKAVYDSLVKVSKKSGKPDDEHDEVVDDDKFEKIYDKELPKVFAKRISEIKRLGINLGTCTWLRALAKELNKLDRDRKHATHYPKVKKILESKIPSQKPKKTKDNTFVKIAEIQIKSALGPGKFIAEITDKWGWYDDPDMIALSASDLADHIELAVALYEKNERKISKLADMDTSSREQLSLRVWNFISDY